MSLSIFVDGSPGDIFTKDQTIAGRVHLHSDKDVSLGFVQIDFAGRCEVNITRHRSSGTGKNQHTRTDHYRSKGYYFYFSQVLYQGNHTHKAGQYSWAFQFTFPSVAAAGFVQSPRGAGTEFKSNPPYRTTGDNDESNPHFLPTSLHLTDGKTIRYYLKARFQPAEGRMGFFHKGLEEVADLPFIHRSPWGFFVPQPMVHHCDCEVKSFKLLPPEMGRGDSFRDKWRSKFNTSSTPCARFRAIATFPPGLPRNFQDIVPWSIQMERLPVEQDHKCEYSNDQIVLEKVKIRKIELKLRCETITRAQGEQDTNHNDFVLLDVNNGPEVWVNSPGGQDVARKTEGGSNVAPIQLGQWGQVHLVPNMPESFATYNFATYYHASMKLTIECGEEDVKCRLMDGVPFEVMAVG